MLVGGYCNTQHMYPGANESQLPTPPLKLAGISALTAWDPEIPHREAYAGGDHVCDLATMRFH